ncbi:dihydroorotase [Gracilinema caldarium]|uniref:Dihydroorotase, multifunctional complex type n=1 Tax=Gracilinema caldarium (strain ATCC 51460 / DSM 7334 / H1) TaxID=744872 RepID=F8EXZ2_GRAC1|nr:dihydroorotase [Gracilinema caldarium]AEJ20653.1 dihydroorotase, multifunctional complex type [Gracilinema caldarium DSM 7334]
MRIIFEQVRLVDHSMDRRGTLVIENGHIKTISFNSKEDFQVDERLPGPALRIDCSGTDWVLMPAFVDLHAHFRDPGFPEKETLESASLAAVAGGYGTVVCMANTKPPIDNLDLAKLLRERAHQLGLIDLYPVLSLTRGMEGRDTSHLEALAKAPDPGVLRDTVRLLSEDGRDVSDDETLRRAFRSARQLGLRVSYHCDWGGAEAEAAKAAGAARAYWSRIEENQATERVLRLAAECGISIHIAHVSTKEALEMVRKAQAADASRSSSRESGQDGFRVTCEVTPHHLACTEEDAEELGPESIGRVNPPLRNTEDITALIRGIQDGTITAIATDHAPHTESDKIQGAPGFIGLETAFAVSYTTLVEGNHCSLQKLSALMSYKPSRILGLTDRGILAPWARADLVLVDPQAKVVVQKTDFKSRSSNSPFIGRKLQGRILMTLHQGQIVYEGRR